MDESQTAKMRWRSVPGYPEYEVAKDGRIRGAKNKNIINKKHRAAVWQKMLACISPASGRLIYEDIVLEVLDQMKGEDRA